jgi:nitroreductase
MTGPGPDEAALRTLLSAGAAAPDHGRLVPWRFLVVSGEGRARLGELFAAAVRVADPNASAEELEKQRQSPLRAPLIIIVVARVDPEHRKIPAWEQRASAAAAAQNILLAAHALGFAAKWSSGKNATDRHIMCGLGLGAGEEITGFLFIGDYAVPQEIGPRPALDAVVAHWP